MSLIASLSLVATREDLAKIRHFVDETGQKGGLSPELTARVRLAIDEAVANVLEHGYQSRPGRLTVELWQEETYLIGQITDEAPPFDPTRIPPPDLSIPAPLRSPGGLGVTLIRQVLDELSYEAPPVGGNRLTMVWRDVFHNNSSLQK